MRIEDLDTANALRAALARSETEWKKALEFPAIVDVKVACENKDCFEVACSPEEGRRVHDTLTSILQARRNTILQDLAELGVVVSADPPGWLDPSPRSPIDNPT